jgi:nucleotide-binding universal stress UspA family protein
MGVDEYPAERRMSHPSRILVPTDFGPASAIALSYGIDLAHTFDAELHVLHAVVDVVAISPVTALYGPEHAGVLVNMDEDSRARLRALLLSRTDAPPDTVEVVVRSMSPANAILEYAAEHGIDFIVMGTHGRSMVAHLLLGSVTETVVRSAACPVLTVRATDGDATAPAPNRRAARPKSARATPRSRKRTVA